MTDPMKIGRRLADLRGDKTMKEVANAAGISVSALAMYESGKRVPRDEIKVTLARYYNNSRSNFFYRISTRYVYIDAGERHHNQEKIISSIKKILEMQRTT